MRALSIVYLLVTSRRSPRELDRSSAQCLPVSLALSEL